MASTVAVIRPMLMLTKTSFDSVLPCIRGALLCGDRRGMNEVLGYCLRLPGRAAGAAVADPADFWFRATEKLCESWERRKPACTYQLDPGWRGRLHERLQLSLPCFACSEFQSVWSDVCSELAAAGLRVGPQTFGPWNDGDAALVHAIWCLVRRMRPENVVETGVAHGLTSRFVLEAMERNGSGHLWSIDLPPTNRELQAHVGMAVGDRLRGRWSYIRGSSRRQLPPLLQRLGWVDLFIHDSLHSKRNVLFEMNNVWSALRRGGAMVIDDIDANWGFRTFTRCLDERSWLVCEAEPERPDDRRFNGKGLFGIVLKS
jgi:hypothetical protein